jgi:uncharacterized protein
MPSANRTAPMLLTLLLAPMTLHAQGAPTQANVPVSLPDTEVHVLHSENVGDDLELWIARPQAGFAPAPSGPAAVLYVLDADLFFGTAVEMTRLMHKLYGELPPLLVVGIAYTHDDGMVQSAFRTRDFTPSLDPRFERMAASMPPLPDGITVEPAMGGAEAFLRFLRDEAEPYVAQRFDVDGARRVLFGSSLGGLFVVHTLLTAPDAFDDYVAVSPALWWNGEEPFELEERTRSGRMVRPLRAFIAVGGLEETPSIPSLAPFRMVTNARRMAERLEARDDAGLEVRFAELDAETHTSVVPVALTRALRALLGAGRGG